MYYSGADERGRNGVGIILSKELKDSRVSVSAIPEGERVIV